MIERIPLMPVFKEDQEKLKIYRKKHGLASKTVAINKILKDIKI